MSAVRISEEEEDAAARANRDQVLVSEAETAFAPSPLEATIGVQTVPGGRDGHVPSIAIRTTDVAIIGLGSWGLCVLERVIGVARERAASGHRVCINVIEPSAPGSGVYSVVEPDYLLMNTPCGEISLYPWRDRDPGGDFALSLYEWIDRKGYRWEGDECRIGGRGRAISEHDFVPRRVMGEYLQWFYRRMVAQAPENVEVAHHAATALDIERQAGGRERVMLSDGSWVEVDHVVITSGHTENAEDFEDPNEALFINAYPVSRFASMPLAGATVAVAGMGLVATDVVTALTIGRGGSYIDRGDRKEYIPSGQEPRVHLYSRGGLPQCAKSFGALDISDDYQLGIWPWRETSGSTPGDARRERPRGLDARAELLPFIYAEMQLRYYTQSAQLAQGREASTALRKRMLKAWEDGSFASCISELVGTYGRFEPKEHFFPSEGRGFSNSVEYEHYVYQAVEADLVEALRPGGSSPVKSAYEVLRFLRDPMREVIEFGGLTSESHKDFFSSLRTRMTRLVAGPPAIRSQQLLALMDAGVVEMPYGPAPTLARSSQDSAARLHSTRLDAAYSERVDVLIRGHLSDPTVDRSGSGLLTRLYRQGRVQPFHRNDVPVGSIALNREFHPINRAGEPEPTISVFGALTEGVRYFTHYVPSPRSRLRAFSDAAACVEEILS